MKNNYKLITNDNESYYEIYFNSTNNTCKIDIDSLEKIKNVCIPGICLSFIPTWFMTNGYITCSVPTNKLYHDNRCIYMHRYLMDQFEYDGKISVDHINQDKTDNRMSNLRLATQSLQSHNKLKMERNFIKPVGFDIEFQLPQYIEFLKEEKIKTIKNGKTYEGILPEHFRVVSKYLGFEKHASKSAKLTIKERLSDALQKRFNLVIKSNPNFDNLFIDGYHLHSLKEFEEHTLEYIKILCGITLDKITIDKDDDNMNPKYDFPEESTIKRNNLPKYVSYSSAKDPKGSRLCYDKNLSGTERIRFYSSGSKNKSLDEKFVEIINLMTEKNIPIEWNVKPNLTKLQEESNKLQEEKETFLYKITKTLIKKPKKSPEE